LHVVGDDRKIEHREPCRIAVGAQHQAFALWPHRRDHASEQRSSAEFAQRLVATAHPPRKPAGEDDAKTHAGLHRNPGPRDLAAPVLRHGKVRASIFDARRGELRHYLRLYSHLERQPLRRLTEP
jgi:hypothetical protein